MNPWLSLKPTVLSSPIKYKILHLTFARNEKTHIKFAREISSVVGMGMGMVITMEKVWLCFLFLIKFTAGGPSYDVLDYQAVGDGMTDDTDALLKAWNEACADKRMATLLIPSGKKILISRETTLSGPCKSPINVKIDGIIMAPNRIWANKEVNLISFNNINNLFVGGQGTIDGQGAIWWDCFRRHKCTRPYLLNFGNCNNIEVRNIKLRNGPRRHLAFHSCTNLTVSQITVTAPGNSPNTDGINIAWSQHIEITGSTFATGDDCIAIGPGTSNVNITKITCGPGHGISIGSLGKGGQHASVENIHVFDCNLSHTTNGARIKTWQGGYGYVRDVTFERINVTHVCTPIDIDQFYTDAPQERAVAISNVKFMDIHGTSEKKTAVRIDCSRTVPCTGLFFDNINLVRIGLNRTVLATTKNAHGTTKGKIIPPIRLLGNYERKQ